MKRKEFIVKSGLLSAGVLASVSAIGSISRLGANDTLNIGIIGTGDRGGGLIPFLNEVEGVNVAACCDILPF